MILANSALCNRLKCTTGKVRILSEEKSVLTIVGRHSPGYVSLNLLFEKIAFVFHDIKLHGLDVTYLNPTTSKREYLENYLV